VVAPIDDARREQVIERTNSFIRKAEHLFEVAVPAIAVRFDLRGRAAGMFRVRHGATEIRYNPWLFNRYFEENMDNTVPHEVAHYVVHRLFSRRRVRPHGKEWRDVMVAFGVAPRTTCSFDLQGIPRRHTRWFEYFCRCRSHQLSSIRHNRVVAGRARYHCRACRHVLRASP